jgi:hypothetical protein
VFVGRAVEWILHAGRDSNLGDPRSGSQTIFKFNSIGIDERGKVPMKKTICSIAAVTMLAIPFANAVVLFSDDFNDGDFNGWTVSTGAWSVVNGQLKGIGAGGSIDAWIYAGDTNWTDYSFQTRVFFGTGNAELVFRSTGHWQNEYRFTIWSQNSPQYANSASLSKYMNGAQSSLTSGVVPFQISSTSIVARVDIKGNNIKMFIDGNLVFDVNDPAPLTRGRIGLGVIWAWNGAFDDVLVTDIPDIPSTVIFAVAGNPGDYGAPLPYGYGIHEIAKGTVISNFVSSPVPDVSGTRYTCTGWSGTGSVPSSGSGTNIVVTVNTNSILTWQWLTEYFLDTTNGPYGSIDTGDGWYSNGAPVVITATPDYGYHLLTWSGDVPVGMEGNNPLTVTMDRPRTITAVFATNTGGRVTSMISASSDDAEQWYDGTVQLVSHDLELTYNVKTDKLDQVVGLRFNGITVPQGATVRSAYIQFTARIDESDPCSVTVQVQQADSAGTFLDVTNDVSSRSVTTTSVRWDPANWIGDEAGTPERTPDLKDLVQEVVNRGGWTDGNSLAFILKGAGTRTAMSYDGDVTRAPALLVDWGWGAFAVPMLTNSEVANVSSTSATLIGDLLSSGGATTAAWIYWGTSDGGTNRLAWGNSISMGTVSEGTFSADVAGLTPNTVYYSRAYAMNSVGGSWAPSTVAFATLTGGAVTNGLVLYWKFDEGSGTVAADSSGSGNTGTLVNQDASSWVAGRFGAAVSFNGWNQYVFDTNLVNAISGDMTLSCWVKFPNTSGAALDLTDSASPGLQVREDGTLGRLGWVNSGGPSTSLYTTWSLHLDGQWHHVAYVRQGTNYSMYVDDRYVGSSSGTVMAYKRLLAGKNSSDTYWVGKMDDLRIYNRALSWGEVGSIEAGEGVGPVDADGDGMADVWEIQYFGSTNAVNGANWFDRDGDGYSNLSEYILGTDPTLASSTFRLSITFNNGNEVVSYPTIAASGAAYYGKTRYYDLQSAANVVTGPWANVPGAADVVGNNAVVNYTNLFPERYRFFRVKVRLQ